MWETILISSTGCDLRVIGTSSSDIWLVDFNETLPIHSSEARSWNCGIWNILASF